MNMSYIKPQELVYLRIQAL